MKLDLDALERAIETARLHKTPIQVDREYVAALVRIARAAVAWRDAGFATGRHVDLFNALREAGL